MRRLRISAVLTVLFILGLSGCANHKVKNINRLFLFNWSYTLDGVTYTEIPVGPLGNLQDYVPGKKGYLTIRSEFEIPWQLQAKEMGLALGKIMIASNVYFNGKEIGNIGYFPPEPFNAGQAYSNLKIPEEAVNRVGKNVIDIVLWVDGVGGISDKPFIGTYKETSIYTAKMTFLYSKLNMIFTWSMFLTAIIYLMLFANQREDMEYHHYAVMNFFTGFYLFPMWLSENPFLIGCMDFFWWNKIFKGAEGLIVAYFATSFIRAFMKVKDTWLIKTIRVVLLIIPVTIILCIPDQVTFYQNLWLLLFALVLQLIFAISAIFTRMKEDKSAFISLMFGFSPVFMTLVVDFILKVFLRLSMVPYMTIYGWQATIISFFAIVSRRYGHFKRSLDYLNQNLEKAVEQRTHELRVLNEELENRQAQADKDMELAEQVQKSIYPHNFDILGWDIAVSFNPLSGVSGDLYDFYILEGQLRGGGLFDVSGHGISSGLVTMLAKNTIFRSFRSTLPLPLNEAMKVVNNQVISVKGEIENYLTGCLFRIDKEDPGKLEFVNAGAPHPIFKSKSKKKPAELIKPDSKKPQYGMIGVPDLEVEFQILKKNFKNGDTLVMYTDGISETENQDGEPFGKERIMDVLNRVQGTANEICEAIMKELKSFAGFESVIDDDITIVVMKKTAESVSSDDDFGELEEI